MTAGDAIGRLDDMVRANRARGGYAFEVTCGDQRPRRAASLKGAKVAMGRLMNNVPKGTRGEIREDGVVVLVGECYSLGWFVVDETFALQVATGLVGFVR